MTTPTPRATGATAGTAITVVTSVGRSASQNGPQRTRESREHVLAIQRIVLPQHREAPVAPVDPTAQSHPAGRPGSRRWPRARSRAAPAPRVAPGRARPACRLQPGGGLTPGPPRAYFFRCAVAPFHF